MNPVTEKLGSYYIPRANRIFLTRPLNHYEKFYNLTLDPYEMDNRATNTKIQKDLAYLSGLLDSWVDNYGNQGTIRENPAVVAEESEKMHTSHIKLMEAKGLSADVSDEGFMAW